MSVETRSTSALFKRAEQLKRWEDSDTNREPAIPKQKARRIKFSAGCVFLAACAAGDKEEVVKLLERGADINTANVDGLTALHQACIDDNLDMVEFLVNHGADVNRGDNEGWTPLHATASCGFLYIAKYLIDKGANIAAVNNDGELAIDIAECQKMEDLLKEEIESRGVDCDAARNEEEKVMLKDAKDWLVTKSSLVNLPHPKNGATPLHIASAKGYTEVIKMLLQCGADIDAQDIDGWTPLHAAAHWGQKEACLLLVENFADMDAKNFVGQTPFDLSESNMVTYLDELKKNQNKEEVISRRQAKKRAEIHDKCSEAETPSKVKKVEIEIAGENEVKKNKSIDSPNMIDVPLKKTKNSEILELTKEDTNEKNKSTKAPSIVNSQSNIQQPLRSGLLLPTVPIDCNSISTSTSTTSTSTTSTSTTSTSPGGTRLNIFKNFFKSFVPPVRDEESETQRKAHAKRVRETRRSTQGVTLEEIKSAEQFIKKQCQPNNNNNNEMAVVPDSMNGVNVTIKTGSPTIITRESEESSAGVERRPSWRMKIDNGTYKFKLEDATSPLETPRTPPLIRKSATSITPQRPSSAPIETADTTITLPLRKPKSLEEKEQDKENDVRNAQATLATQAAIQRRKRPKRRSTGVVSFDNMDDFEKEKETTCEGDCDESAKVRHQESGTERNSRSRVSSISDIKNENGEIDYKKLYEQQLVENDRLKEKLKKSEDELRQTKQTLEKINVVTSKNSLSELEKRERRAMERKLSEMEEELKQLQKLKAENERLKADNRSLTRVINKLTSSTKK